jgi:hypothetical protein
MEDLEKALEELYDELIKETEIMNESTKKVNELKNQIYAIKAILNNINLKN